ncbi:HNHc domain-containing protein [Fusarium sp. LHS14.1]|nr:HNHc domain-containing protein [Fusarium sp. LHS14.1]
MATWSNPLGTLGRIPSHPVAPSQLSSALSDLSKFENSDDQAERLLDLFGSPGNENDEKITTFLRIFKRYLSKGGQAALNADIYAIGRDDAKLRALANHIREAVLKPMKVAGGQQPQSLITPPTYAQAAADIAASMSSLQLSTRRDQANLKRDCLRRDGYRCVYSGAYEYKATDELVDLPSDAFHIDTECAHILPFSLRRFDSRSALETENTAIIWCALHRYFPALKNKISTDSINQASNALTLGRGIHGDFGSYRVYFWPSDDPDNAYTINWTRGTRSLNSIRAPGLNSSLMELQSHDSRVPMPDPEFLKVHARIAQMLDCVKYYSLL